MIRLAILLALLAPRAAYAFATPVAYDQIDVDPDDTADDDAEIESLWDAATEACEQAATDVCIDGAASDGSTDCVGPFCGVADSETP